MQINLTREQLESSRTRLAAQGINLIGDNGTFSHSTPLGVVTISFGFNEPKLNIEVLHKPFLLSLETINEKIQGWFAGL